MKYVILIALVMTLIVGTAFAANLSLKSERVAVTPDKAISITPGGHDINKNATNAHWQVVSDEAACVVDGGTQYYTDDDTWMYAGPYDLSGYLATDLEFYYSLAVADSNDVLSVYVVDSEPTDSSGLTSPLATYSADEAGTTVNLDPGLSASAYIVFRWESDDSGIDDGARVDDIILVGAAWDSGTEVYTQTTDTSSPYTRSLDISAEAVGTTISLGWWYFDGNDAHTTHSNGWYWGIDDIVVTDDTKATLYSEDFEGGDPVWDQTIHGGTGEWEMKNTSTQSRTGMTGNYYTADDYYPSWSEDYDVEAFTPDIDCTGSTTVQLDWGHNFQDFAGAGICWLNVYAQVETEEVNDDCSGLGDWTMVDEGTGVGIESASLGNIKALFK